MKPNISVKCGFWGGHQFVKQKTGGTLHHVIQHFSAVITVNQPQSALSNKEQTPFQCCLCSLPPAIGSHTRSLVAMDVHTHFLQPCLSVTYVKQVRSYAASILANDVFAVKLSLPNIRRCLHSIIVAVGVH